MRKFWMVAVATLGGLIGASGRAEAWQWGHHGPWASSAAFPTANPPGWYTNTYSFAWYYPWFAYYNYSHGPYANWMSGGGFAWYSTVGSGHPMYGGRDMPGTAPAAEPAKKDADKQDPKKGNEPAKVLIQLPDDARLYFNGTPATGAGALRSFATPPLTPGQSYAYDLTAEVTRDGRVQTVTERVVVRAGEKTSVTLNPGVIATAGAK